MLWQRQIRSCWKQLGKVRGITAALLEAYNQPIGAFACLHMLARCMYPYGSVLFWLYVQLFADSRRHSGCCLQVAVLQQSATDARADEYLFGAACVSVRFIKDDYLQQNSYTKYDKYCPFYKSVEMMRNIVTFHRLATAAVERTASGNAEGQKITLNIIKQRMSDVLYKVTSQKFEDPGQLQVVSLYLQAAGHRLMDGFVSKGTSCWVLVHTLLSVITLLLAS